jgi:hypothetical protein
MPRQITLEEAALVIQLEHRLSALLRGDQTSHQPYEATLDQLVKLARPDLTLNTAAGPAIPATLMSARRCGALSPRELAEALIPETPPASPLSPDATGAAASTIPPQAGGGLITEEGLRDALAEWQIDTISGVVQVSIDGWVDQIHTYILRHCDRQTETAESAAA